jgi:hypothetical protein
MALEEPGMATDKNAPSVVTTDLLANARSIASPAERGMALQRIAKGAIASGQLDLAHKTLEEATTAASGVTETLVRDQRLIALVTTLKELTEAYLREADPANPTYQAAATTRPEALPKRRDVRVLIRFARLEWQRAVYLAGLIANPTYRNEVLYKVAEGEASASATVSNQHSRPIESDSTGAEPPAPPVPATGAEPPKPPVPATGAEPPKPEVPATGAEPPKPQVPATDAATPSKPSDRAQNDTSDVEAFRKLADDILLDAFKVTDKIDRRISKYRAQVRVVLLAADSDQFARGFELAQRIENGEMRAEAMLLLAEAECRHNKDEIATASYQEAAQAIGTIHQEGLRAVLANFLIDSLIMTGRFEDARRCIVLFPQQSERLVALGAIAEAQGRRGTAESARQWIAKEIPEEFRPTLYRRVVTGVLWAVEQNRSKEFIRSDSTRALP